MDFGVRAWLDMKRTGIAGLQRWEGMLGHLGPLVVAPGSTRAARRTTSSSSANRSSEGKIWWGKVNRPFEPEKLRGAHARAS